MKRYIDLPKSSTESISYDLSSILPSAYLYDSDIVFAGGSIVERIGNRFSDVDVHVITDRYRNSEEVRLSGHYRVLTPSRSILKEGDVGQSVFLIHTLIPGTHVKVDIEYRTHEQLDNLIARVLEIFDYASQSPLLLTKKIDNRDKAFLNRMFNSIALQRQHSLESLCNQIGKLRFQYLLYRWAASDFSILIDLIGAYQHGELHRACDLARERLIREFQSYMHLLGCTNFNRKWLLSYARNMTIDSDLLSRFEKLFLLDSYDLKKNPREYIRDTVEFIDHIMHISEPLLTEPLIYPSKKVVLSNIDRDIMNIEEEYARFEGEYRKKAYGVAGNPTWMQFDRL